MANGIVLNQIVERSNPVTEEERGRTYQKAFVCASGNPKEASLEDISNYLNH